MRRKQGPSRVTDRWRPFVREFDQFIGRDWGDAAVRRFKKVIIECALGGELTPPLRLPVAWREKLPTRRIVVVARGARPCSPTRAR
jgi:hypothetical protein